MFITPEDYNVVIGPDALKVISQASAENIENAQCEAIEEIASYLRPEYDTDAIFSAAGKERNRLIVMYTADIAIYHLLSSLPGRPNYELRKERYDRAINWLEGVQSGKIVPDLPAMSDAGDAGAAFGTIYSSERKLRHNW